jgi:hypothetical protein
VGGVIREKRRIRGPMGGLRAGGGGEEELSNEFVTDPIL